MVVVLLAVSCTSDPGAGSGSTTSTVVSITSSSSTSTTTTQSAVPESTVVPSDRQPGVILSSVAGFDAVEFPEGVAAWNEVLVWTGSELVFWGGEGETSNGVPAGEPGHAYDLESNVWRTISPSPKPATYGATGVWTGDEVIICCGAGSRSTVAYSPATDVWRSLFDAPISGEYAEAVWTGSEMIVVTQQGAAAYNPSTDQWRSFSQTPTDLGRINEIVWMGPELAVWPVWGSGPVFRRVHQGLALDPATDTWRIFSDPPVWPAALDLVWSGDDLVIWGGLPAHSVGSERAVGSRLDVTANAWAALPEPLPEPDGCECNLGSQTLLWTGDRVLVSTGHFGTGVDPSDPLLLAYHPDADTWNLIGESPVGWGAMAIMAGDRVVFRSDRLYVSEPGWAPSGTPIPSGGLPAVELPAIVEVAGLTRVGAGGATFPAGPELTVAATNGQAAISLLELRFGTRADYGGAHTAGDDALDLTITPRGDLIVWNAGPPKLYEHHGPEDGYGLLLVLTQPPRLLDSLEGSVYPTDDGFHAWVWAYPTSLEYVETSSGDVLASAELPAGFQPVFTAGDSLVITDDDEIAIIDTTGTVAPHGPGQPIEATPDVLIWEDCERDCALFLSRLTNATAAIRIDLPPAADRWTRAGAVSIPSSSPDLPTIARDHGLLLVDAVSGSDPETVHRLTIVDLNSGAATVVKEYEGPGWASAFWDRTGTRIIVATNNGNGQDVSIIDADSFEEQHLVDALPQGYWILGAG